MTDQHFEAIAERERGFIKPEVHSIDELTFAAVAEGAHTHDDVMTWLVDHGYEFNHNQVGSSLRGQSAQGDLDFTRKHLTYSIPEGKQ